jgi:hypothetical protein
VTTRGDEVKVALSVVTLQSGRHSEELYPSPLRNQATLAHPVVPKTGTKGGAPGLLRRGPIQVVGHFEPGEVCIRWPLRS